MKALSREIKKIIIRWSLQQLQKLPNMSYEEYEKYGVADIIVNQHTGEPMYVLN